MAEPSSFRSWSSTKSSPLQSSTNLVRIWGENGSIHLSSLAKIKVGSVLGQPEEKVAYLCMSCSRRARPTSFSFPPSSPPLSGQMRPRRGENGKTANWWRHRLITQNQVFLFSILTYDDQLASPLSFYCQIGLSHKSKERVIKVMNDAVVHKMAFASCTNCIH